MESGKYLSTLLQERRLTKHMIFILMNPHPMSIDLFDVDILQFTCTHTHMHAQKHYPKEVTLAESGIHEMSKKAKRIKPDHAEA